MSACWLEAGGGRGRMRIHVKEYSGHMKALEVVPTNTVMEVMELYHGATWGQTDNLCFFFKGKILQEEKTLEFYNIKNMDSVIIENSLT